MLVRASRPSDPARLPAKRDKLCAHSVAHSVVQIKEQNNSFSNLPDG
jgi:hypothetical protein